MKKKYILIIILLLFVGVLKGKEQYQYKKIENNHKQIIQEMINDPTKGSLLKDYYGYVDIPKIRVRRVIVPKYSKKLLDKDFVCIFYDTNYLEKSYGNTILVGHNNRGLFKNLKKLELNDYVYIHIKEQKFNYKVIDIKQVNYDKYTYSYENKDHLLTIITCTKDKTKRLVVTLREDR